MSEGCLNRDGLSAGTHWLVVAQRSHLLWLGKQHQVHIQSIVQHHTQHYLC